MNHPSIACGPPIAASSSGIVTKGPTPIMARTLTAVAPPKPSRRSIYSLASCAATRAGSPEYVTPDAVVAVRLSAYTMSRQRDSAHDFQVHVVLPGVCPG